MHKNLKHKINNSSIFQLSTKMTAVGKMLLLLVLGWRTLRRLPDGSSSNSVCRVRGVFHDVPCPLPSSGAVQVLDRGQRGSDSEFCSPYSTLQSCSVLGCSSKPNRDGGAQDRLYDCSVELQQNCHFRS